MVTALQLINPDLPVLNTQDDPANGLNLMDQFRVGHLAVTENGKFMGVISETELLSVEHIAGSKDTPFALANLSVDPDEHVLEVLRLVSEHQLTIIPVVDKDRNYIGSITLEDLVGSLSRYQGVNEPGAILVLSMDEKDYSLQQIARIVEENDSKILSLNVISGAEPGELEVNIKINKEDVNAIMQSFNRFNINIKASYQEPEYTEDLKKRYEELMRYLNI